MFGLEEKLHYPHPHVMNDGMVWFGVWLVLSSLFFWPFKSLIDKLSGLTLTYKERRKLYVLIPPSAVRLCILFYSSAVVRVVVNGYIEYKVVE